MVGLTLDETLKSYSQCTSQCYWLSDCCVVIAYQMFMLSVSFVAPLCSVKCYFAQISTILTTTFQPMTKLQCCNKFHFAWKLPFVTFSHMKWIKSASKLAQKFNAFTDTMTFSQGLWKKPSRGNGINTSHH